MKALGKLASEPLWTGSVTTVILDIYGDHVAELDALRQSYTRREADRPTRGEDTAKRYRSPVAAARSEAERTGPTLDLELKPHRAKRSLDATPYAGHCAARSLRRSTRR